MPEETFVEKFQATGQAKLLVRNIRGSVEIHSGEEGIIEVTATKRCHSGDEKHTVIEIAQETDGTVKVITHFPEAGWNCLSGSQPCEVDYAIKAPRRCPLDLHGISNTVLAEGFNGAVNIDSVSGEITLRDLSGSLQVHTVSGDIRGEHISGVPYLVSVSGDVTFDESSLASLNANTVSGNMQIHTLTAQGPYNFKSVSGDVHFVVPRDARCTVDTHSISGELFTDFPVACYSQRHRSRMVNIQGGGVRVSMKSISGTLFLEYEGGMASTPQAVKNTPAKERWSILESLENGYLTVDEALQQLRN
jgi:hypothetical protein